MWASDTSDGNSLDISIPTDGVYSAAFSSDGTEVAVACFDGWIRLYDAHTGTERLAWEAHPGSTCHSAAYSSDGRRLITASWDKTARIWDPAAGDEIAVLDAGDGVYASAISNGGDLAATSGPVLRIWDVGEHRVLSEISVDGAQCTRLAFSRDGRHVASAWSDGYARIHSTPEGGEVAHLGAGGTAVNAAAFLPDGRIATGDAAGVVRLFTKEGRLVHAIDTSGRGVNQIACAGGRIAVATDKLWLLEARSARPVLALSPHTDTIWDLSWNSDGSRIATCRIQGVVRILGR
jgi:WD40 repeat protein